MTIVALSNGQNIEFPDEMSSDQIKDVLRKKYPPKNAQPQPGFLERAANDVEQHINQPIESFGRAARNLAGGYAQGLANIAPGLYNLGASGANALGINLPKSPMFDFVPHDINTSTGELASFFGAPGFLKVLGKVPEFTSAANNAMKIPMIAEGVKHASNILGRSPFASRIAGNAILGGAYAPDNPLMGMGLGGIGGLAGEALSKGYTGIKNALVNNPFLKNAFSKINPGSYAKAIEHKLSGGINNVTENSKQLASDIRNAYKSREAESSIFFNHALNKAGNEKIYKTEPMMLNKIDESQDIMNKIKNLNIGDLYHAFKAEPTFNNAHKLQSELGSIIRKLESNPNKTQDELNHLKKLTSAREQLKNDIFRFLERHDEYSNQPIAGQYKKGMDLFREHVAPYLSHKKLIDITKGDKTNVKNIHFPFNTPSNKINKLGQEEVGSINKILQDLPEESKNKILFNAIGGNKRNPNALLNSLEQAKSKGYGSYFNPELENMMKELEFKIRNKKRFTTGAGILGISGTAALGHNALTHLF